MACIRVLVSIGLAAALPAQTPRVLPPSFAAAEASGSTNVPFGRSTPMRAQHAYDALLFAAPATMQALAFRLEGGTTMPAKQIECELRLASMAGGITWIQSEFARNLGADATVVVSRRVLDLPALGTGQTPSPFHLRFPFEQSFAYPHAGRALVVDVTVHAQQPGVVTLDAPYLCASPQVGFGAPGCGPNGGLRVASLSGSVLWGRAWVVQVLNAVPQAQTALFLGTLEGGSWNGWTLPIDLGVVGAPGCSLSTDPVYLLSRAADALGRAEYQIGIPSIPSLQGGWLRFQGVAQDAGANALGWVASDAGKVQICGWEAVARVYAPGVTATVGSRELGVAPVMEVTVR